MFANDPWLLRVYKRFAPLQPRLVAMMLRVHGNYYSKDPSMAAEGFDDILIEYFNEDIGLWAMMLRDTRQPPRRNTMLYPWTR